MNLYVNTSVLHFFKLHSSVCVGTYEQINVICILPGLEVYETHHGSYYTGSVSKHTESLQRLSQHRIQMPVSKWKNTSFTCHQRRSHIFRDLLEAKCYGMHSFLQLNLFFCVKFICSNIFYILYVGLGFIYCMQAIIKMDGKMSNCKTMFLPACYPCVADF